MQAEVPLGKITKKIELKIPTIKKEIDEASLRDIKLRKMQEEIDQMKKESAILRNKLDENIDE